MHAFLFYFHLSLFIFFILGAPIEGYGQNVISLETAIQQAVEQNNELKANKLNIELQEADKVTAQNRPNPVFNQQSMFLLDQINLDNIAQNQHLITSPYSRQTWFQVTKVFQVAGQRKARIQQQDKKIEVTAQEIAVFSEQIAYQTALQWLTLAHQQQMQENIAAGKQNADSLLIINKIRLEKKLIPSIEYTKSKILAETYEVMLKSTIQQVNSESQKLQILLNTQKPILADLNDDIIKFPFENFDDDSLLKIAAINRSEVVLAKKYIDFQSVNIELQKKLAYPSPEFGLVSNPQNSQRYLGWYFQMQLPFFNQNQGEIQRAKISHQQAQTQLLFVENKLHHEVKYALEEYKTNRENLVLYKKIMEDVENMRVSVKKSYLKGEIDILDYLQEQSLWYKTQKDYDEALFTFQKSYLQLLYFTGLIFE